MQQTDSRIDLAQLGILDSLPSPPAVAVEILRLSRSPDVGLDELAEVLMHDPAMSLKVVRVANSAAYRRRGDVVSVAVAATRLGMRSLVVVALGFSLVRDMPKSGRLAGMDLDEYWHRSLTVATVARRVAARCLPHFVQEAFIVGLFAHLGRLVLAEYATALYQPVVLEGNGWPNATAERGRLGFSSNQIGAALLRAWSMPDVLIQTVEGLHEPAGSRPDDQLITVVQAAMAADAVLAHPADGAALLELDGFAAQLLGGTHESEELLSGVTEDLADAHEILDLDPLAIGDVDVLLTESRSLLVNASVALAEDLEVEEQRSLALRREVHELQARVREDALTRLPNRSALDEFLGRELELRRRGGRADALGVLLIDIDRFKLLNDEYGHQVGDDVLRLVAASLSAGCRRGELLARYGGEEFVLVAPSCDPEDLYSLGERLRGDVQQLSIEVGDRMVSVTVSIGGACSRDAESSEDGDRLIQKADGYLYRAKRRGRNRTEVSPEDLL
jgi:diguanylate cyclase (GGDEF)-like protein